MRLFALARSGALAGGVVAAALAIGLAPASARQVTARQVSRSVTASQPVVMITSVSPTIARPKHKVVVSGTVTNPTSDPVSGLMVQLWSSSTPLTSRYAMSSYLRSPGPTGMDQAVPSAVWSPATPLAAHASRTWSLTLPVSQVGMTRFGVYPVAAQLTMAGTPTSTARTFLPFWPGRAESRKLKQVSIAWIWPLISVPQQAACKALLYGRLAASVAPDGRLGELLAAGQTKDALRAHLTWAIDPSLLSSVHTMTTRYQVGGGADCSGTVTKPASISARNWLAEVQDVAAHQDYFTTPYADVDVAALARRGLDSELASAFNDGRRVAKKILGQAQHTTPPISANGSGWIAWPANGIADYTALQALAANKISTVILSSGMMPPFPPVTFTPSAVTTTPDGLGSQLNVLLADDTGRGALNRILSTPASDVPGLVVNQSAATPTPSTSTVTGPAQAAAFAREQWFLAETAMIAAEKPSVGRAVVVTPPRRWDPGLSVANALLSDTVNAPWLRPVSIADMVRTGPTSGQVHRSQPPQHYADRRELSGSLLRQVRHLVGLTQMAGSILTPPQPGYLSTAVDAVESSAWQGGRAGRRKAEALLHRVSGYVSDRLQHVGIVNTLRVTLGGKSGEVPVTVSNRLRVPVRVRVQVSVPANDRVTIGHFTNVVTVDARTQRTIKIPVRTSVAGTFTLSLRLATPAGRPLPGKPTPLTVEATHFGTLAVVIIGVALVVFVITAAARAIRGGRGRRGNDPGEPAAPGGPAGPDRPETRPDAIGTLDQADTVEPERDDGAHPVKEPDDQASTPRRAGQAGRF